MRGGGRTAEGRARERESGFSAGIRLRLGQGSALAFHAVEPGIVRPSRGTYLARVDHLVGLVARPGAGSVGVAVGFDEQVLPVLGLE